MITAATVVAATTITTLSSARTPRRALLQEPSHCTLPTCSSTTLVDVDVDVDVDVLVDNAVEELLVLLVVGVGSGVKVAVVGASVVVFVVKVDRATHSP